MLKHLAALSEWSTPGGVKIYPEISDPAKGLILILGTACLIGQASITPHRQLQAVNGHISSSSGALSVRAPRQGVVTKIMARQGSPVLQGAPLIKVTSAEHDGKTAAFNGSESTFVAEADSIARREAVLNNQRIIMREALSSKIEYLRKEISQIDQQITSQNNLLRLAREDLEMTRRVAARGFVAKKDVMMREALVSERERDVATLNQSKLSRMSDLLGQESALEDEKNRSGIELAQLLATKAQLNRSMLNNSMEMSYTLTSNKDGVVASTYVHDGEMVQAGQLMIKILPRGSHLVAEVGIPQQSIGRIKKGDIVRLKVDAFPFERFGHISGTVLSIDYVPREIENESVEIKPLYFATIEMSRYRMSSGEASYPLWPGMTVQASLQSDNMSILEWIFSYLRFKG